MGHASRFLRRLLLALVVLVVLVIAVVELISWNFLKPPITERFEAATGRSLTLDGDISVDLLPRPQLTLRGIQVGNPSWGRAEHLLEVERLTIAPSISELLTGQVVLADVKIQAPTLNLEQRADAPGNWVLETGGDSQPDSRPSPGDGGLPATFRDLSLWDGRIRYWSPEAESPQVLSVDSLQVRNRETALQGEASLALRERTFQLKAETDNLEAFVQGQQAFGGEVSLTSRESALTTSFNLPQAPALNTLRAEGRLRLQGLADWSRWLGVPPIELQTLVVATDLERANTQWRLSNVNVTLDDGTLSGALTVDTAGPALALNGRLHSPRLDVEALRAALPVSEDEQTGLALAVIPNLTGAVGLSVEQLILQPATLKDLEATVLLGEHRLALQPLIFEVAQGSVEASASLTSSPGTVKAQAQLILQDLDLGALELALDPGDTVNGRLAFGLTPMAQQPRFTQGELLGHLRVEQGRLTYANDTAGTDLTATVTVLEDSAVPSLAVSGRFRGKPVEGTVTGDPLPELTQPREPYRLTARATSDGLEARVETSLGSISSPRTLTGEFMVSAEGAQGLETWLGTSLPPVPAFHLSGQVSRDGTRWSATDLSGEIGGESVGGTLHFNNTPQPSVEADLDLGYMDLRWFLAASDTAAAAAETAVDAAEDAVDPDSPEEAQVAEDSLLAPLRRVDVRLDLHADTLVLPNALPLHGFDLAARLDDGQGQVEQLQFEVAGGSVDASLAVDARGQTGSGRLDAEFDSVHLGQLADTFTPLEERLGRLSGALHLDITERRAADTDGDLLLPFIGRVIVEPSRLRFQDPEADTDMSLTLATRGLDDGEGRFEVQGEGRYDGEPLSLAFQGDPLLNLREAGAPYGASLQADIVGTKISASGILAQPLKAEGLEFELAIAGPNPQRLSRLLGVALPQLPAYSVSGDLTMLEDRWLFEQLQGTVGESDIAGELALDIAATPPRLSGSLHSDFLDIKDLGVVIGAEPPDDVSDEEEAGDRFILPDEPLIGDAYRTLSADVEYQAETVQAGEVPLSQVYIDLLLEDGHWQFDPLRFGIGQGHVDLVLELDGRPEPPSGTLLLEVRGLKLQEALQNLPLADDSIGILGARGKFWVEGRSVAELLASADGGLVLLMNGGRLEAVLVELAGLDAGQAFTSWLRDREAVPIDCAYADLQARDGVFELDTFVVDTDDTTFTAGGEIDLNNEQLDVTLMAHPKDASIFSARSPLHLGGTLANVEVGVHGGTLTARTAASALLAAVTGPVSALLPLLDLGTGEDVVLCQGLTRQTRQALDKGARE